MCWLLTLAFEVNYAFVLFSGILVGKIIFALCIAKFFIVFAFDGFYVYSAELFPTVIRYSMTRLHFEVVTIEVNHFASLTGMGNGIMNFETDRCPAIRTLKFTMATVEPFKATVDFSF